MPGTQAVLIPESVVYGEDLADDTIVCDFSIPPAYRAAQKPVLGEAFPASIIAGNTAPWGYIVVETGSFTTQRGVDRGAFVTGVKYARPKVPFVSGITGMYEVARRPATGRLGRHMGERVFLTADETAEASAETYLPELSPMAATGNWHDALLREKIIERRWRVGIARITARYDTYAQMGEVLVVGKGVLECDADALMLAVQDSGTTAQLGGHYVNVPFLSADGLKQYRWVIIKGSEKVPFITADLRIRAVLAEHNLGTLAPLVGKFNSGSCSNIIGAGPRCLWFNRLQMRQRKYGQSSLYDCTIHLKYDAAGFDTTVKVQLQRQAIRQETVYQADKVTPVVPAQTRIVLGWVPDGAGDKEIQAMPDASFSYINGLLS